MKPRPWLEKEDPLWSQQVKWNTAREIVFNDWNNAGVASYTCKQCPLIEEACWYLSVLPCTHMCIDRLSMFEALQAVGDNPRAMTYAALVSQDNNLLEKAALMGDAAAQCWVAKLDNHKDDSEYLLMKSMQGGYSEAFTVMARVYALQKRPIERKQCLITGIAAGSPESMMGYARLDDTEIRHRIYWLGRNWLEMTYKPHDFTILCSSWQLNYDNHESYYSRGFVYGSIFNQLPAWRRRDMSKDLTKHGIYESLSCAHEVYLKMCRHTSVAVYAWLIVGRRIGVVKDVSKIIGKLVWHSRDHSEWYFATGS
jgi:hypothetical protein